MGESTYGDHGGLELDWASANHRGSGISFEINRLLHGSCPPGQSSVAIPDFIRAYEAVVGCGDADDTRIGIPAGNASIRPERPSRLGSCPAASETSVPRQGESELRVRSALGGLVCALLCPSLFVVHGGVASAQRPQRQPLPAVELPEAAGGPRLVGQAGGWTRSIAIQGNRAVVGEGPVLRVLDVSDPSSPRLVGQSEALPSLVRDVHLAGDIAYVALGNSGLRVMRISKSGRPNEVGARATPGPALGLTVAGGFAYVATGRAGISVLDVSQPQRPIEVATFETAGAPVEVFVAGTRAYVAAGRAGLRILDISDPATPQEIGAYTVSGEVLGVRVEGSIAYLAAGARGLRILDVSTPAAPTEVAVIATEGRAHSVRLLGQHVFVGNTGAGMTVVDVANPAQPVEVASHETTDSVYALEVAGEVAYVNLLRGGLQILSLSNPASPAVVGRYDTVGGLHDLRVGGTRVYAAGDSGVAIFDVSDPSRPTVASVHRATWGPANAVYLNGSTLYATSADGGLRILDVSDPRAPREIGAYDALPRANDVFVSGSRAYVTSSTTGLWVFDVADPSNPTPLGRSDSYGNYSSVYVSGQHAYVAADDDGLRVIDVSDPSALHEVTVSAPLIGAGVNDVQIAASRAYAAVGAGLRILDVSDPAAPTELGRYTGRFGRAFRVAGSTLYLASERSGLWFFDVSDPASPSVLGSFPSWGATTSVDLANDLVYFADDAAGLVIIRRTGSGPGASPEAE